jgi:dihydroorotate dehydrogenase
VYRQLVRPLFFSMAPETAHDVMRSIGTVANIPLISSVLRSLFAVRDPRLRVELAGLSFPNPIGLAAGLDKNAELIGLWNGLGFGHSELGTVTAKAQPGNPKPRIFRLAADHALINRMGFPSEGADHVERRLRSLRRVFAGIAPVGINIGKSKVTEIDDAIGDYQHSFSKLAPLVDYVTVNVSSPNTPGLRQLQERDRLMALLSALQSINNDRKPIFVKLAPDLTFTAVEEVLQCCFDTGMAGVIATNTTLSRDGLTTTIDEAGGLSGEPLKMKSLEMVRFIGSRLDDRLALIGVGGVSSSSDLLAMLAAGASMVQIYTTLIYRGPGVVREILRGVIDFMDRCGCSSLREAAEAYSAGRKAA